MLLNKTRREYFLDFPSFNFEKLFEIKFLTYFYLATSLKPLFI